MANYPWFRLYSEILTDRKIKRICAKTGQPKALIVGAWATLLALANDSPERGKLMISDDIWLTRAELRQEMGIDDGEFSAIMCHFSELGMVDGLDDAQYVITKWDGRQFKSDHSSPRVAKHREKKRREQKECNDDVTLQEQPSDVIDTDTDTDTEQKQIYIGAGAPAKPLKGRNLVKAELETFFSGESKIPIPSTRTDKQRRTASIRWWGPLLEIASLVDDDVGRAKALISSALTQMDKDALTVSAPQSIVEVAKSIHGRNERGGIGRPKVIEIGQ